MSEKYKQQIEAIQQHAGTPVIFQSFGLTQQSNEELIASYAELATETDKFIAFELGTVFAPFGSIYTLDAYEQLMLIPQCMGAKHSSLDRVLDSGTA